MEGLAALIEAKELRGLQLSHLKLEEEHSLSSVSSPALRDFSCHIKGSSLTSFFSSFEERLPFLQSLSLNIKEEQEERQVSLPGHAKIQRVAFTDTTSQ